MATEEHSTNGSPEQATAALSSGSGASTTEQSLLERKIIRQVEFYFGDRNLPRDKFLQEKIKEDDGWVLLDVLLTFNRLKSLSTDPTFIVAALRKSTEGIVEVSKDGKKVRRCPNLPSPSISLLSPDQRKELRDKTVYLKGFPEDSTLDEVQELLEQYGETVLIQMRRMRPSDEKSAEENASRGKFKGSVLAEFKSKESMEQLLKEEEIKFRSTHILQAETKEKWLKRKTEERHQTKQERKQVQQKEKDEEKKKQLAAEAAKVKKEGCVLHFKGVGVGTRREQIRVESNSSSCLLAVMNNDCVQEYFRQFATVAWVYFQIGEEEGYVRFEEEGGARKTLQAIELGDGGSVQLCGGESKLRVLEGEEEQQYWEKMVEDQSNKRKRKPTGGGYRGGRGGRRGGKRPASSDGEEPSAKQSRGGSEVVAEQ